MCLIITLTIAKQFRRQGQNANLNYKNSKTEFLTTKAIRSVTLFVNLCYKIKTLNKLKSK